MSGFVAGTIAVLAHQGGWDELLLVAGPIAVIVGLVLLARRRVDRAQAEAHAADEHPADDV